MSRLRPGERALASMRAHLSLSATDDYGWSYEIVPASGGDADCEDAERFRLVRWGR